MQEYDDMDPIDFVVDAKDYVKHHPSPEQDGLVTDAKGRVIGKLNFKPLHDGNGGTQVVCAFRQKDMER